MPASDVTLDEALKELATLTGEVDDLLKAINGDIGKSAEASRVRVRASLAAARESCVRLEEHARHGAHLTDKLIREHPYESLGVAAVLGLLVGILMNRK